MMLLVIALLSLLSPAAHAQYVDTVVLRNGDVIRGEVIKQSSVAVTIVHPDLGRLRITMDRVQSVTLADRAEGDEVEQAEPEQVGPMPEPDQPKDEPEQVAEGPVGPTVETPEDLGPEKPEWTIGLTIGGSFTNNDEGAKFKANARIDARRLTTTTELKLQAVAIYEIDDRTVDENRANASITNSWLLPDDPVFKFLTGRFDWDQFRSWSYRLQAHGGIGYRFKANDSDNDVRLALGAGMRKDIGSIEEPLSAEGLIGVSFVRSISERQRLTGSVVLYPTLISTESPEFGSDLRVVTTAVWTYRLAVEHPLSFNTALEWEYSTSPDPGFPPNNILWTYGLQWDW